MCVCVCVCVCVCAVLLVASMSGQDGRQACCFHGAHGYTANDQLSGFRL